TRLATAAGGAGCGPLVYRSSMAKYDTGAAKMLRRKGGRASTAGSTDVPSRADHRDLYAGLIRLHVLHHACKEKIYGLAMIKGLRRHDYELSAGTLYPILHGLEQKGLLTSVKQQGGGTARRLYRATRAGRAALAAAKTKVRECSANCSKTKRRRTMRSSRRYELGSSPST